jgi:hypothetical protein
LQSWLASSCGLNAEERLVRSLEQLGAKGVRPFDVEACHVWEQLADEPVERWWHLAAKQLYWCGGPSISLSALRAETEENRKRRASLLEWYKRLGPSQSLNPAARGNRRAPGNPAMPDLPKVPIPKR